jgi:small subunit ribosomal protein S9
MADEEKPKEEKIATEAAKPEVKKAPRRKKAEAPAAPVAQAQNTTAPAKEAAPQPEKKPRKKSKKGKQFVARGKRKESIARASIRKGVGRVRVNSRILNSYFNNRYLVSIAHEALDYIGEKANTIDINIRVYGGGIVGQAQATRTAIANALVEFYPEDNLKEKFLGIDKSLVIEDSRRVETKKYKGPKARARFQKSYR